MNGPAPLHQLITSWQKIGETRDDRAFITKVQLDLAHAIELTDLLKEHVARLSAEERDILLTRSIETATHYKWCLSSNYHRGTKVWLHVYKTWRQDESSFAASIHDHRYSFVSAVLRGSLHERRWSLEGDKLAPVSEAQNSEGSFYSVLHSDIHSIEAISGNPVTLVVQAPTQRSFSTVYERATLTVKFRKYDLEHAFSQLSF